MTQINESYLDKISQKLSQRISEHEKYLRSIQQHCENQSKDWFIYLLSFIEATEKLIVAQSESEKNNQKFNSLNIAIMFNFRHSIELAIKFLTIVLKKKTNQTSLEKLKEDHNLQELVLELENKQKLAQFLKQEKALEHMRNDFEIVNKTQEEKLIDLINKKYNLFIEIAKKYHFNLPILSNINPKKVFIEDTTNQLFRYPVAKNIKIEIDAIELTSIKLEQDIITDLQTIKFIANILYLLNL